MSIENLYALVGYGGITANKVIARLKEEYRKHNKVDLEPEAVEEHTLKKVSKKEVTTSSKGVQVNGIGDCLIRFSKCCNPVPGDSIIGYITRGRGVSIHRKDCVNVNSWENASNKLVEVAWANNVSSFYFAEINITGVNRPDFLMDITNVIAEVKVPIKSMSARTDVKGNTAIINLILETKDIEQLSTVIRKMSKIKGIVSVTRR